MRFLREKHFLDISHTLPYNSSMATSLTDTKILQRESVSRKNPNITVIQSSKPSFRHYWPLFSVLGFATFLAFNAFGTDTITGQVILVTSGVLFLHSILTVCITRCVITHQGIQVRKWPFSIRPKEMNYMAINNITVKQGAIQKRLKVGNLIISDDQKSWVLKGIKHPHKIKELINKEKASDYERRTLWRKIL